MEINGFTYVRNGFKMGYPFIPSIQSLLPIVSKMIIVVGDSIDGTREAIMNLNSKKIIIIDSIWDEGKRNNGEIFKEQSELGMENITGDWCIHLQADEVIKESSIIKIFDYINLAEEFDKVDGLLFPFYHFWGDYNHIRNTRRTHAYEIRAFKNHRNVRPYRDSQGFRKIQTSQPNKKEIKLKVIKTDIPIYHYAYTRNPKLMSKKWNYFHKKYYNDEQLKKYEYNADFDYNEVDRLELFKGTHPIYMKEIISKQDWKFEYDPKKSKMLLKDKILYPIEKYFNYRLFDYKNYKIFRLPYLHQ